MFGINDPWIFLVYLLTILSTIGCVVYGIINWNKGKEHEKEEITEELKWQEEEEEINENL